MVPLAIAAALLAANAPSSPPELASASTDEVGAAITLDKPVVHPLWTQLPSAGDYARLYPRQTRGIKGAVTARCLIDEAGRFTACDIIQETPARRGFGKATVELSKLMKMKTTDGDGFPVAGRKLTLPVVWYPQPQ